MSAFYNKDLSSIHHEHFGSYAANAAIDVLRWIKTENRTIGSLIDLGCGSGILAKSMTQEGIKVLGIDYSEDMLEIARREVPTAQFVQGSFFDVDLPKADIITAIGEPFNYLADGRSSHAALDTLLRRIRESLNPGGLFVFDMLTREMPKGPILKWFEQATYDMVAEIRVDTTQPILTRKITSFIREGMIYRKHQEVHQQYLFDRKWVQGKLEAIGFEVAQVQAYNNHPFRQGHIGFWCR